MASTECCCLCNVSFNVVSVKKRKLLHGRSACDELAVLKSINEPLAKNLEGYLCVICQRKLLRVEKLRQELQSLVKEINSKLSNEDEFICNEPCKLSYK